MAAITWLARRSRICIVKTRIINGVLEARELLPETAPAEVLAEAAAIGTVATDIGLDIHTIVEGIRAQNKNNKILKEDKWQNDVTWNI